MHLYKFDAICFEEMVISAESQLKAIEIFEGETGELYRIPSQMYGGIEFAFKRGVMDLGLIVQIAADDGCIHAIADADAWAEYWPNRIIEFKEWWGEQ